MPDSRELLAFVELRSLRRSLRALLRDAAAALEVYFDKTSGGFYHLRDPDSEAEPGDFSKSSSATVINFLVRASLWEDRPWAPKGRRLAGKIETTEWASAGLEPGNPFTSAFLLEALNSLSLAGVRLTPTQKTRAASELDKLVRALEADGGIRIDPHSPNAYLTQLAVRVLHAWDALTDKAMNQVHQWASTKLDHELAILNASPEDADSFEIAYSVVLLQTVRDLGARPLGDLVVEREIARHGLETFFRQQLSDGTWPRGHPLFHYPRVGNAYSFDYELLVQMLQQRSLWRQLLFHLPSLKRAVDALEHRTYLVGKGVAAWASGHHRHFRSPESWSTASVLHYCFELDRLAAEGVRTAVFGQLDEEYTPPRHRDKPSKRITPRLPTAFLDSEFQLDGTTCSLRETVEERFLKPLYWETTNVAGGRPFSRTTPTSAIFFGAPGTSKTQLAAHIAHVLGWPLLRVDPSHLTREGLASVQRETDQLFAMLAEAEEIVVLFDEIEELVRERGAAGELLSRFLTTAMLPKLALLSERRQIVFLVATNHLEVFDEAIRRPGRFDMIVPVNPPTAQAKLVHWKKVTTKLNQLGLESDSDTLQKIGLLTYGEFNLIVSELLEAPDKERLSEVLDRAAHAAVLNQVVVAQAAPAAPAALQNWKDAVESQQDKIRLPAAS